MTRPQTIAVAALRIWLVAVLGWVGTAPALAADPQENRTPVAEAKAAILLNLPKYVNWPDSRFEATNSPVVIAVFANDEVADEFAKLSRNRTVNGRPLLLKRAMSIEDCSAECHVLFVGDVDKKQTASALARAATRQVLTVGEQAEFLERGGMINLAVRERKVRLQVNLAAARHEGLQISARLLAVADVKKADAD